MWKFIFTSFEINQSEYVGYWLHHDIIILEFFEFVDLIANIVEELRRFCNINIVYEIKIKNNSFATNEVKQ